MIAGGFDNTHTGFTFFPIQEHPMHSDEPEPGIEPFPFSHAGHMHGIII